MEETNSSIMTDTGTNTDTERISTPLGYYLFGGMIMMILFMIPLYRDNYVNYILIQILFFSFLGQAWNIMCGYTGQLSFGHAAFFGIGCYTSSLLYLKLGITPWVGMFLGGILASVTGIGVGYVSFRYRLKSVFFAFVTLTTAEMLRLVCLYWESLTGGAQGILIPWKGHNPVMFMFEVQKKYLYYYTILLMFLGVTMLAREIKRRRIGYYFSAIRENEDAAEMLGIDTLKYRLIAVGMSAFLTGLAGTFYAQYFQHFEPDEIFGPMRSFEIIFPVIVGGGGSIIGPPIGALVLQLFEETTRAFIPSSLHGFHRIIYGVLIVFLIVYIPGGIISMFERWRNYLIFRFKG